MAPSSSNVVPSVVSELDRNGASDELSFVNAARKYKNESCK
ncbi:hypothetical protein COLO4_20654 [Corchorus olitorius]|uniref:Uncharacterized protein n=1 Tax=Corchorus olitorius TaxID=93759 RepID=A0A1R3IY14_9ROSI|nr:hypothetical protein COLO4_20654 [Corchorus olitorius]